MASTRCSQRANIAEKIDISANGRKSRFTRDIAVMDARHLERVLRRARGSTAITVGDLSGTDVTEVSLNAATGAATRPRPVVTARRATA